LLLLLLLLLLSLASHRYGNPLFSPPARPLLREESPGHPAGSGTALTKPIGLRLL